MTYDEFTDLKILAEKKGNICLYKEIENNSFDKNLLWVLFSGLFLCVILLLLLPFFNQKEGLDISNILICLSLIFSIICGKKFVDSVQKTYYEKNIIIRKKNQKLKKKFIERFKKEEQERVYIAIKNLLSNLINQKIIKNNAKEFKLSKKEFNKMLSKQIKYDNKLLKKE